MEQVSKEQRHAKKAAVLQKVLGGQLTQMQAAIDLGLSRRQIIRLSQAVRAQGASALVHKLKGRPSNRGSSDQEQKRVIAIAQERYSDFGPTLAGQYLREHHQYKGSTEQLRLWMIAGSLWRPKQRRAKRAHPLRERRPRFGELVQIDGSHHDWFEGRGGSGKCCLTAFIDDATGRILGARFSQQETTQDYFAVLRHCVQTQGSPLAIYSDRHAIFTKHDPQDAGPTQFERALMQLSITPICARTPQAKGRVERLFQTLQDRLCKAMRIDQINDIAGANVYLCGYIREHNSRFAVAPQDAQDAHTPYAGTAEQLWRICALHHSRQLGSNGSLRFEGSVIQVQPQANAPTKSAQVGVVRYSDDRLEIVYRGHILSHQRFELHPHLSGRQAADAKGINTQIDALAKPKRQLASLMAQMAHQEARRLQGHYGFAL
jgi:transposase InsO family protein